MSGQAGADHLDLGQLGHGRTLACGGVGCVVDRIDDRGLGGPASIGSCDAEPCRRSRRTPSPRRPARPPSWSGRCRCRRAGRPTRTWAVNVFMWSGPSSSMTYSGTPEVVLGGELLERGLPVQAGAERGGGLDQRVEEPVHDLGGHLDAAAEVDGADHGLDGVGEDRRLVAAAGGLLAAAELDVLAEPDAAADLGQRAGVDDRGAQLGQPALGEVGVGEVEGLGDDDAEHGVTEELQPLVGRQPTVLVGVRAVGQGALEQLGVQDGFPEGCAELARSRSAVGADRGRSEDLATVRARAVLAAGRRTRGAAGAWHRRRGWRRSPASARWSSRPSDGGACCCATSSASGLPWCSLSQVCSVCVDFAARPAPPTAGRSPRRVRGRGRRPGVLRTRGTGRDSRPCTAAGTAVRAPPRPAAAARGRPGRPPAC